MSESLKTTGPYSNKLYRCNKCKSEKMIGTNHWGEIYPVCKRCGEVHGMTCMEPMPEGYAMPEPWKIVKLGDIATIVQGGVPSLALKR
jgi:hypothetical protein